ncbi:MAG TPA: hypothetical protein VGP47_04085 [Parachlamydiaceae bacterium]|nr:hypothetical protein [Parachlamydiaceae bacterium]
MSQFYYLFIVLSLFATNLQAIPDSSYKSVEQAIECLYPENELERQVISSEEWREGARWGEPRKGHPEGAVIYHIHEVLGNVEKNYGDSPMREKLRIITIIHDTFKHQVDMSLPTYGENQHGMLARRFAEKYITDQGILEIIQRHDDAYFAWRFWMNGNREKSLRSVTNLIEVLGDDLELFTAFYECDNATGDKTPDDVIWFKEMSQMCYILPMPVAG